MNLVIPPPFTDHSVTVNELRLIWLSLANILLYVCMLPAHLDFLMREPIAA